MTETNGVRQYTHAEIDTALTLLKGAVAALEQPGHFGADLDQAKNCARQAALKLAALLEDDRYDWIHEANRYLRGCAAAGQSPEPQTIGEMVLRGIERWADPDPTVYR